MLIHPEVIVTPDCPTVKFRQPRENIELDKELTRILHTQGWGCGTFFNVQFINHDRTKLLACARFVVCEEVENFSVSDVNQYQTMAKTTVSRRADQIGDWWIAQDPDMNIKLKSEPQKTEAAQEETKNIGVMRDGQTTEIVHPPLVDAAPPKRKAAR